MQKKGALKGAGTIKYARDKPREHSTTRVTENKGEQEKKQFRSAFRYARRQIQGYGSRDVGGERGGMCGKGFYNSAPRSIFFFLLGVAGLLWLYVDSVVAALILLEFVRLR